MEMLDAERLASGLMRVHGVGDWTFGWNRRKRALGLCRYQQRRIELSRRILCGTMGREIVRDTVLHEIAMHAGGAARAGHGPKWKAMCVRLWSKPERCDKGEAVMPRGRWEARCPTCGKEYWRH